MNIFEEYKNRILVIIKKAEKDKLLILPENLNDINVDSTPSKIDFDISTNVCMVLSKSNNKPPNALAEIIIDLLKKEDNTINDKEESIAAQNSNAKIKKFKTEEDSIKQFLDWVENKYSYSGVREEIKLYNEGEGSKERIIDAIAKTGFAEDKKWSGKIKSILNKRIDGKHKKELQKLATILFTGPQNKN